MNDENINIHFCLMAEYSTLDSENILMIAFFLSLTGKEYFHWKPRKNFLNQNE